MFALYRAEFLDIDVADLLLELSFNLHPGRVEPTRLRLFIPAVYVPSGKNRIGLPETDEQNQTDQNCSKTGKIGAATTGALFAMMDGGVYS